MTAGPSTTRRGSRPVRWATALAVVALLGVGAPLVAEGASARALHVEVSVPSVLAASGTSLWVANTGTGSLLEFDVATGNEVRNVHGTKFRLYDSDSIVLAAAQVWVANAASESVTILNAKTGGLVKVLAGDKDGFGEPLALAVCDHRVFVLGAGGGVVVEFEASTDTLLHVLHGKRFHFNRSTGLAVADQHVWVLSPKRGGSLTELDPTSGAPDRIVSGQRAALDSPVAIAGDGADLWVANGAGQHLSEVDAVNGQLLATPHVATLDLNDVTSLVATKGRLWLSSTSKPTWVACVRTRTDTVLHALRRRFGFPTLFAGAGHLWVVDRTESRVTELNASTGAIERVLVN